MIEIRIQIRSVPMAGSTPSVDISIEASDSYEDEAKTFVPIITEMVEKIMAARKSNAPLLTGKT